MTEKLDLTLRGVAIRGERLKDLDELSHGINLPDEAVTLRTVRDVVVGTATVSLNERGDVVVEATVPDENVLHLIGNPYLCVAARLNEDTPADLSFILLSTSTEDPFERPYGIVAFDPSREELLRREGYRPVRVVDEAHLVAVSFDPQTGATEVDYDEERSHVEWHHALEIDHRNVIAAVTRALGRDTWADLDEEDAEVGRRLLGELQRLGLRGRRR